MTTLLDGKSAHGLGRDRLERVSSVPKVGSTRTLNATATSDEGEKYVDPVFSYGAPKASAAREACAQAGSVCRRMCMFSRVYNAEKEKQLPTFERSELVLGDLLGQGGFSDVFEIRAIHLKDKETADSSELYSSRKSADFDSDDEECSDRKFLSKHAQRVISGESRYAIKYLSPDITSSEKADPERFITGAIDIALEIKFLSSFEHPNIVKMRGKNSSGWSGFKETGGFFIILDRLYDILETRLPRWNKLHPKYRGDSRCAKLRRPFSYKLSREMFAYRLRIAFDIASALEYLHYRNIIYRDLKPDNIGFDVRDDVKIFDFGLAREVMGVPDEVGPKNESMYEMTPNTGTQRYMAPEVSCGRAYNLKADVYSFGIILWQIIKIEVPYKDMTRQEHVDKVMKGPARPKLKKCWSPKLQNLLESCWSEDISQRPRMDQVTKTLKEEILSLPGSEHEAEEMAIDMKKTRRRSTYVSRNPEGISVSSSTRKMLQEEESFSGVKSAVKSET